MKSHSGIALFFLVLLLFFIAPYTAVAELNATANSTGGVTNETPLLFLGNPNIEPVVFSDRGIPSGVAVDIIRAIAPYLSRPIEIETMNWSEAQVLVASGDGDALIQFNPTPEREKIYDFSDTLLVSQFSIFTRSDRLGITGAESLRGLNVGVEAASLPQQVLEQDPQIHLSVIPNFTVAFQQLSEGSLDAVVVDYRVGSYIIAKNAIKNIKVSGDPIAYSNSAIGVKKGNTQLLNEINTGLRTIKADGTYQKILDSWAPTEGVFETQQQITQGIYKTTIVVLIILFLITAAWIMTLRRELMKRKTAEEKLQNLNNELENRVIERTNELLYKNEELKALNDKLTSTQNELSQHLKELTKSEVALRVSEERFRLALRTAPVSVAIQDKNLIYRWAYNQTTRQPDEIIGKTDADFFAPEDVAWLTPLKQKILDTNEIVHTGNWLTSNGKRIYLDLYFEPLLNTAGEIIGIGIAAVNQTDLKNAEQRLRESEEKYRNLFMNMTEEVHFWQIVRDTNGRIITWRLVDANPPTLKTWGKHLDDIVGKTTEEIFGPGATDHYMPVVEKILSEGIPYSFEDYFPNLDKYFRFTSVPLGDYFITTGADITAIKKNEREITQKNAELNALNEELIATQEELQRNLGELNKVLAEKDVLLSEIHHRVKNNLTAFISLLSLEGSTEDSQAGRLLKQDLQNRARSMALIHETLYRTHNFSQVDMQVYISTLVDQIINSYGSVQSVHTIVNAQGITLDLARATPLGLIVNELVTNSIKYAFPESFNAIKVRGAPPSIAIDLIKDEGDFVLTLKDNGIGLPVEIDIATTKTLGLKLVNFLAKHQLRAIINVDTKNGTEFVFRFRDSIK